MPLKLLPPSLSSNLRNHRKILVVDQHWAFVGGMNIGDRQMVGGFSPLRTADIHFKIEGPIVSALRAVFGNDWSTSGGLDIEKAVPQRQHLAGGVACRLIADGPDEALDHLALTLAGVISAARSRIVLMTPYFLPDRRLLGALQSAALRGVEVVILIPAHCNWPVVRWALNHVLWDLLSVGVRVLEQPGVFAHSKCLLIDDEYALIGSANIDARSLRLNFELGIEVSGAQFTQVLNNYVGPIMASAQQVSRNDIAERSLPIRLRDALAALFSPYL